MTAAASRKRNRSPVPESAHTIRDYKRARPQEVLTSLTTILEDIKSTPSSAEISSDKLETLKHLLLHIEHLASDETNMEAKQMRDESDRCLENWFGDLLEQCEADGFTEWDLAYEDDEDDIDLLALALAWEDSQQDAQGEDHQDDEEDEDEEIIIVDDDDLGVPGQAQLMYASS
ncbi:uncharacterized protein BYT42DRAFT_575031 [Radiomyces spectabilis]|uniref:uncharacterized protein n=1 Tax=Radiomyces spectabilis TaxID=64574 RepID=UPI00221FB568|nr:uncharacterized protein BYT42DRAFT_575031 [Radiomyces spectabilis]KAI8376552.1 hypothetical protein BYT42DRAFT_575031 [Radiomyces spectabilis]